MPNPIFTTYPQQFLDELKAQNSSLYNGNIIKHFELSARKPAWLFMWTKWGLASGQNVHL